jgi:hypothetical protein
MIFKAETDLSKYRIHHVRQWLEFVKTEPNFEDINAKIRTCAIWSGIEESIWKKVDIQQVNEVFYVYIDMLSRHKKRKPRHTFTVGKWWQRSKQVFTMPKHFKGYTAGQIADAKTIEDYEQDAPLWLATIFVPKGEKYGDSDRHERAKVFAKHYPADEFINMLAFFFESYERRNTALLTMNMIRARKQTEMTWKEMQKEVRSTFGRETST